MRCKPHFGFGALTLSLTLTLSCSGKAQAQVADDAQAKAAESHNAAADENWENRRKKDGQGSDDSLRLKEIVEPKAEYNYASFGRPDPFVPPDLSAPKVSVDGKTIKMTSPLQGFAIAELLVKGVWQTSSGEIRAVVLTPKGEGVVVKKGDPISSGKVVGIARDSVKVRLYRLRSDGIREYEDVTMPAGLRTQPMRGEIRMEPGKEPVFVNPEDPYKKSGAALTPAAPATAILQGIGSPPPPAAEGSLGLMPMPTFGLPPPSASPTAAGNKTAPAPGAASSDFDHSKTGQTLEPIK